MRKGSLVNQVKSGTFKYVFRGYTLICLALITTSLITGRRASLLAGEPHYLLTRTSIYVERKVPPGNATDAAVNAVFEDAGVSTSLSVKEPVFVLGLLDVTAPVVVVGGLIVLLIWRRARRRPQIP
jgi:hypothetical protein